MLKTGPRGGHYYVTAQGRKQYLLIYFVDRLEPIQLIHLIDAQLP